MKESSRDPSIKQQQSHAHTRPRPEPSDAPRQQRRGCAPIGSIVDEDRWEMPQPIKSGGRDEGRRCTQEASTMFYFFVLLFYQVACGRHVGSGDQCTRPRREPMQPTAQQIQHHQINTRGSSDGAHAPDGLKTRSPCIRRPGTTCRLQKTRPWRCALAMHPTTYLRTHTHIYIHIYRKMGWYS